MKKMNIFTLLMIVAVFEVSIRLFDISTFSMPTSAAASSPPAQSFTAAHEQPPPPAKKEDVAPAPAATDAAAPEMPAAPPQYGEHGFTAAELDVLQSLSKRRDELDRRELQMGQHEALLKAAEIEVDRKITELNKIKSELEALLNKQQTMQGAHIDSLVKIYEGMKPKEAARIFDTLEMDVLMSVVGKMSERKSSPILASMDPEKARRVTIKLSEQQKLPNLAEIAKKDKGAPAAVPPSINPPAAPATP